MKLYYMYDDKFIDMKKMFLDNLKDKFELFDIKVDSPRLESNINDDLKFGGGIEMWKSRANNIIQIIRTLKNNESFIFSDIDIMFYNPCIPSIEDLTKTHDILFLRELYDGVHIPQGGNINIGFSVIKANQKTYNFFCDVLNEITKTKKWEQKIINEFLYQKNDYDLKWDLLPHTFLSTSVGINNLNKNTILFHANCALTLESKFGLINYANNIQQTCA